MKYATGGYVATFPGKSREFRTLVVQPHQLRKDDVVLKDVEPVGRNGEVTVRVKRKRKKETLRLPIGLLQPGDEVIGWGMVIERYHEPDWSHHAWDYPIGYNEWVNPTTRTRHAFPAGTVTITFDDGSKFKGTPNKGEFNVIRYVDVD